MGGSRGHVRTPSLEHAVWCVCVSGDLGAMGDFDAREKGEKWVWQTQKSGFHAKQGLFGQPNEPVAGGRIQHVVMCLMSCPSPLKMWDALLCCWLCLLSPKWLARTQMLVGEKKNLDWREEKAPPVAHLMLCSCLGSPGTENPGAKGWWCPLSLTHTVATLELHPLGKS